MAAAHALLVQGVTPTVESAARAAHISRTTAYRYFSNQRELIAAALPEVGRDSLLSAEPPAQAQARVDLVVRAAIAFTIEWGRCCEHHFGCPWIPMANVRRCAVDARSPGTSMPLSR